MLTCASHRMRRCARISRMTDERKDLPPERLWQPITARWFVAIFGGSLAYAVLRYHLAEGQSWAHFPLFIFNKVLALASVASAENAIYEIPAAGVSCGGSAAHAEAAVRRAGTVESVKADPVAHTVVAEFDPEVTSLDSIVASLQKSGMETGEPKRIN